MADLDEPNGNPTMDGICFNLPSWRAFHMFHLSSYQTNGLFTADWLVRSTLVVPKYLAYELHQLVCYIFNQAYWAKLAPLHPGSGAAGCIGALMVSIWSRWWPGTSGVHHGLPWPNMAHHGPPSTTLQPWGPLQRSLMVIDFGKGFDPEQKTLHGLFKQMLTKKHVNQANEDPEEMNRSWGCNVSGLIRLILPGLYTFLTRKKIKKYGMAGIRPR